MACSCSDQILGTCGCCCGSGQNCNPPEPSQGPRGEEGPQGEPGADGADGHNSFTTSTSTFVQPAVGNNVSIPVAYGLWAVPGQDIYAQTAGYMRVVSATSTTITATNLGAVNNAAPTTVIATNRLIGPAGYEGAFTDPLPIANGGTGETNATDAFDALSPLTTNGDIIARLSGANARIAIGTNNQILQVVAGVPAWTSPSFPASAITSGTLAIARGGTNASTAGAARTSLQVPGLNDNNTFGSSEGIANLFIITGGSFSITSSSGGHLVADKLGSNFYLADASSDICLDWQNKALVGAWDQPFVNYVTASGATYTIPATSYGSNVTRVVSTRSSTGTQTITLPAGVDKRRVVIVDGAGSASTNNITIARAGSDTIMGATSAVISLNYGTISLIYHAATTNWIPIS